ncbi:MAG: hypothetical protein KDE03_18020 [Rhodobacteraceae bacterium]|nr:hypothetical protein [Paracoccaceae bacterium]
MQDEATLPPRRADWRDRLVAYIAAARLKPFRPGQHDCALFVAGAVEVMTGHDFGRGWRGKYRSLEAGQKLAEAQGYADHTAIFAALCPDVAPSFAQVGDIMVMPGPDGTDALGVLQGEVVFCLHPGGIVAVSRLDAKRALRV